MKTQTLKWWVILIGAAVLFVADAWPAAPTWRYRLIEGSQLVDDCPICGRPTISVPLRGSFDLRLVDENPLFRRYEIENVSFESPGGSYRVTGRGTYRIGGEVAVTHELMLEMTISDSSKTNLAYFTNSMPTVTRLWPMLHSLCDQTNGTLFQVYQLEIAAAPLRDIWFSTVNGFTAGNPFNSTNPVSGGDLVSWSGNLVKRNSQLTMGAGLAEPDVGLDAVDVLPGGEIIFSTDGTGTYSHSTLRFSRSLNAIFIQDLLAPIIGGPPAFDPGLDAVQVDTSSSSTLFYFSLRTNMVVFQDPQPHINLRRGDILVSDLSMEGRTFKRYAELLTRFRPVLWEGEDFGLDALYIWPSGEIWFSAELGFQSEFFGAIMPGDLLSDQGYVVFRNLELLSAFAPIEDLADFGLDALYIITDAAPVPTEQPRLTTAADRVTGNMILQWQVTGRVSQLERALEVAGPWAPLTPFTTDASFTDAGVVKEHPRAFYRVRQW